MENAQVPLDVVVSNEELGRRRARAPDHASEKLGMRLLADALAGSPRQVLQKLSDVALELCRAHSAGISLLELDGERPLFRWHAVSGRWAHYLWNTLPREFSPCGTVLDRKAPQLMILPHRHFTPMEQISPGVAEVLLIPFSLAGVLVGTVWVISHDGRRTFDGEDQRILSKLAKFASVAYQELSSLSAGDVLHLARLNKARALPGEPPPRSIQRKVLVVDDNPLVADSLAALLQSMGHVVRIAYDGDAALEAARDLRPDIVLLDIGMPRMSGYEVARQMRRLLGSGTRIFAVTGYDEDGDRLQSQEAGFDQHLVKPLDAGILRSLIG